AWKTGWNSKESSRAKPARPSWPTPPATASCCAVCSCIIQRHFMANSLRAFQQSKEKSKCRNVNTSKRRSDGEENAEAKSKRRNVNTSKRAERWPGGRGAGRGEGSGVRSQGSAISGQQSAGVT